MGKIDYKTVYLDGDKKEWVIIFRNDVELRCNEKMFDNLRHVIGL